MSGRLIFIALVLILQTSVVWAQEQPGAQDTAENDLLRFSFSVGRFLPNRIAGIHEIIPTAGFRMAYNRKSYYLEASIVGGNAHSVNFYTMFLDARSFIDRILPGFYWVFGLQNMFYKRTNVPYEDTIINDTTHQTWAGWHYGFGYVSNSKFLAPRIDFYLAQKPGISLYMNLGFEF